MEFSGEVLLGFLYVTALDDAGAGSVPAGDFFGSAMVHAFVKFGIAYSVLF